MADAHDNPFDPAHLIGHVKDARYIEVPTGLTSRTHVDLPQFRDQRQPPLWQSQTGDPTVDGMLEPFDLAVTKFMVIEVVAAVLVTIIFVRLAQLISDGTPPRGPFWNLLETMLLFIRDQVARPAIGHGHHEHHDDHGHGHDGHGHDGHGQSHIEKHSHGDHGASDGLRGQIHGDRGAQLAMTENVEYHEKPSGVVSVRHPADRYLPFLWTLFFFILGCNLLGLVPWAGSPTGALAVTGTLALITFGVVIGSGMMALGPIGFWLAQVPKMDLPLPLAILLKPMILMIEIVGLLIKHFVLSVRLLANVMAGHLVLVVLLTFIVAAGRSVAAGDIVSPLGGLIGVVSIFGAVALSLLEMFVAFLQAYIFTFLSALFIGAALHEH